MHLFICQKKSSNCVLLSLFKNITNIQVRNQLITMAIQLTNRIQQRLQHTRLDLNQPTAMLVMDSIHKVVDHLLHNLHKALLMLQIKRRSISSMVITFNMYNKVRIDT